MAEQHHLANYVGELKDGRMHGKGTFWFETGTRYEGEFRDGAFHGKGTLYFTDGACYKGEWKNGIEDSGEYFFNNGLQFDPEDWSYCLESEDRRFYQERVEGLNPADRCVMSAESDPKTGKPLRVIPDYCYDAGDGIYDPVARIVFLYSDDRNKPLGEFLRNVTDKEHEWIVSHCRKGWDEFMGATTSIE